MVHATRFLLVFLLLGLLYPISSKAQQDIYNYNWKIDVPVTLFGVAGSAYGFYKIGQKPSSDSATVVNLDRNDIIPLNRSSIHPYDEKIGNITDIFFYGAYPYPFLLLLDKDIRRDGWTVYGIYLETIALVGAGYSLTAAHVDKYRPYVYHPETSLAKKKGSGSINSFYGGHPSATAAATFFTAKVYGDYHPESAFKYVVYGAAGTLTLASAYFRWKGGYHFLTDMAIGVGYGTALGILIPEFHKKKNTDTGLFILPFTGQYNGLNLTYRL